MQIRTLFIYKIGELDMLMRAFRGGGIDYASSRIKSQILAKRIDLVVKGKCDISLDGDPHVVVSAVRDHLRVCGYDGGNRLAPNGFSCIALGVEFAIYVDVGHAAPADDVSRAVCEGLRIVLGIENDAAGIVMDKK